MSSSNNNKSFFDSNTILALIITFAIFFGWQSYLKKKYPDAGKSLEVAQNVVTQPEQNKTDKLKEVQPTFVAPKEEKIFKIDNDIWSFELSSQGMGVKNVVIKKINKVAKKHYKFESQDLFFPTKVQGEALPFLIDQRSESQFIGKYSLPDGLVLEKEINIDSETYSMSVDLRVLGDSDIAVDLSQTLDAVIKDPKRPFKFFPAFERNEFYVQTSEDIERKVLMTNDSTEEPENYKNIKILSLADHYFAAAFINESKLMPAGSFGQKNEKVVSQFSYGLSSKIDIRELSYKVFIGPKDIGLLEKVSNDLVDIIDFTYLGFIARPIIKALNFLYGYLGNYGLAVIVLTLLIRLLIMPLAVSSFKSMKKMQVIQPQLKSIKEKYKDNPQKVNQMTMQLMKENKVNPMGGCLPMLLQLPIFFAFYRGLSESVDLYQAPFLWIQDLSQMDPYFIFPILSMVGMTLHQLLTPSTMDKTQKRVMMAMPIVFGLLFVTLPSALTLYMAVSTWFGIGQHYIFLRDKPAA